MRVLTAFQLVRKEFKPRVSKDNHEQELKNLSILKLIEHPNIIQLLACYELDNKINFIFPLADGGNLGDLFKGNLPDVFHHPDEAIHAFSGVFSALRSVHNVIHTGKGFRIELLGCHHDLKPQNILVHGRKLLLADFGLSRLKEHHEGSETDWKSVHQLYCPPESFVANGTPDKRRVHRSSDIWSLGCIATEFMAFREGGPEGVKEWFLIRKQEFEGGATHRFHNNGHTDPAVSDFIRVKLESKDPSQVRLAQLCKCMLVIDQSSRPGASFAAEHIQTTAILAICTTIDALYKQVQEKITGSFEAILQQASFESWKHAAGIDHVEDKPFFLEALSNWPAEFESVYAALAETKRELDTIADRCSTTVYPEFRRIQHLNDMLLNFLGRDSKEGAEQYLRIRMSSRASATEPSDPLKTEGSEANQNFRDNFALLASIRAMQEVSEFEGARAGSLDGARLKKRANVGDFQICTLTGKNGENGINTIVEYKYYIPQQSDKSVASELHQRLQHVTALLQKANSAGPQAGFRILPCEGFYQDHSAAQCGLVYRFPRSSRMSECFTTLHDVLKLTIGNTRFRPPLDKRFSLARELSTSLANLHSVQWLHRRVSSHNIGFFYREKFNNSWRRINGRPYFLGFLYSRSDGAGFTEGPTDNQEHRLYQHPNYLKDRGRYEQAYDYYSMGLLLLEIGLWQSLEQLQERNKPVNGTSKTLHNFVCEDCVPRLAFNMGKDYMQAVVRCLKTEFDVDQCQDEDEKFLTMHQHFLRLVVGQISKWSNRQKIDELDYTTGEGDLRNSW